jgi:type III secretory pathway component EscS
MAPLVLDSLLLVLYISLIPMVSISLGAGLVGFLQAITQIQEQSLTHLARVVVIAGVLYVGGAQAFDQLKRNFIQVLDAIVNM